MKPGNTNSVMDTYITFFFFPIMVVSDSRSAYAYLDYYFSLPRSKPTHPHVQRQEIHKSFAQVCMKKELVFVLYESMLKSPKK